MKEHEKFPHKAVIRVIIDYYPLMPDGQVNPLSSKQDGFLAPEIYGKNLQECIENAAPEFEKWKKKGS